MQVCCTPCCEKLCMSLVTGGWQGEEMPHKPSCDRAGAVWWELGDLAPCSMNERHLDASHDLGTKAL